MSLTATERVKYARVWREPEYRIACHSLALWRDRRDLFPESFSSAIDLGCGLGLLVDEWLRAGIDAWAVDLTASCLDPGFAVRWGHRFREDCLWSMRWDRGFDFGVCADVMEHIPRERVTQTLRSIGALCGEVLFKIAHSEHHFIGECLHLTIEPSRWWVDQMTALGGRAEFLGTQSRSGYQDSLIRWRTEC